MTHFINKSGETIPPFACMQICIPPDRWEEVNKLPLTDGAKQVIINLGEMTASELPRYDQDCVLYCIKPNRISALLQEPTTVAFNGPSFVAPDKQGVCTVGQYPVKSRGSSLHYPGIALGIASNSWSLATAAAEFGAFRGLYPTTHQLAERKQETVTSLDEASLWAKFVGPNNYRKIRFPLRVEGSTSFLPGDNEMRGFATFGDYATLLEAEDSPVFLTAGVPANSSVIFTEDDQSRWFDNGRIDPPGLYRIRIRGVVTARNVPEGFTTVPVNISLRFEPDGSPSATYPTSVSNSHVVGVLLHRYVKIPEPNLTYAWPQMQFEQTYFVSFRGEKGRFVIKNESSPYVQPASPQNPNLIFEITRMTYNQVVQQRDLEWSSDLFQRPLSPTFVPEFYQPYYAVPSGRVRVMFLPESNESPF